MTAASNRYDDELGSGESQRPARTDTAEVECRSWRSPEAEGQDTRVVRIEKIFVLVKHYAPFSRIN